MSFTVPYRMKKTFKIALDQKLIYIFLGVIFQLLTNVDRMIF